jgi:hypothetical protein
MWNSMVSVCKQSGHKISRSVVGMSIPAAVLYFYYAPADSVLKHTEFLQSMQVSSNHLAAT